MNISKEATAMAHNLAGLSPYQVAAALQKLMDEPLEQMRQRAEAAEKQAKFNEECFRKAIAKQQAAEARLAECVREVREWYDLQAYLQFEDTLLAVFDKYTSATPPSPPSPASCATTDRGARTNRRSRCPSARASSRTTAALGSPDRL